MHHLLFLPFDSFFSPFCLLVGTGLDKRYFLFNGMLHPHFVLTLCISLEISIHTRAPVCFHRPMLKRFINPPHFISRATPTKFNLLSPTHGQCSQQKSGQITIQSVLINTPKFLKVTRHAERREIVVLRSMAVEVLSWLS